MLAVVSFGGDVLVVVVVVAVVVVSVLVGEVDVVVFATFLKGGKALFL